MQTPVNFSAEAYRAHNLDLQSMTDQELIAHFLSNQCDRRLYGPTKTTAEFLSMRWLRGAGTEIGAGSYPTRLYGNASADLHDFDKSLVFGGSQSGVAKSLDDTYFAETIGHQYSFAVASHVLEHCDSFIRALENLCKIVNQDGIVYIVLPDIDFLQDKNWMPWHDFAHHVAEYATPLLHAERHMKDHMCGISNDIEAYNKNIVFSEEYKTGVRNGYIPESFWFIHHKHNYRFDGWLRLIMQTIDFLGVKGELVDCRYGHERMDCHFVIQIHGR
jgi:hypothetical protein